MAGNRDPEPLLPVCKSRASHFIFFSNFFSNFAHFRGGRKWTFGGSFEEDGNFAGSDRFREDTHTDKERKKKPEIIKMKNSLVLIVFQQFVCFFFLFCFCVKKSWKNVSFVG
jgi:hypothetical protein